MGRSIWLGEVRDASLDNACKSRILIHCGKDFWDGKRIHPPTLCIIVRSTRYVCQEIVSHRVATQLVVVPSTSELEFLPHYTNPELWIIFPKPVRVEIKIASYKKLKDERGWLVKCVMFITKDYHKIISRKVSKVPWK